MDLKLTRETNTHYRLNGKTKIRYKTQKEAVLKCYEMNMQDKQTHRMVSYYCPKCKNWHIGNSKSILTDDDKIKIRKKYREICIKLGY